MHESPSSSPIAFFAYNRPDHTLRSLTSLAENPEARDSELHVFSDAARATGDRDAVDEVRRVVRERPWCGTVHIHERAENMGCARSIIQGVSLLCRDYGTAIVMEDDLVVSPHFLYYMNTALERYSAEPKVMQVSGYMFPVDLPAQTSTVFLPFTTSWGWATWERAWTRFDPDMGGYDTVRTNRALRRAFDLDGSYPFFDLIEAQRAGRIDSWAIRWYLSAFMTGGLTLYPVTSLVANTGFDGSGTHCGKGPALPDAPGRGTRGISFPTRIEADRPCLAAIERYLRKQRFL